jgi:hypothetical protein
MPLTWAAKDIWWGLFQSFVYTQKPSLSLTRPPQIDARSCFDVGRPLLVYFPLSSAPISDQDKCSVFSFSFQASKLIYK